MDTRSIRIPEARVRANYETAFSIVENAEVDEAIARTGGDQPGRTRFISPVAGTSRTFRSSKAILEETLKSIGKDDQMLSPRQHGVLYETRRAIAVGMTVSEFFVEPLGYLVLGERKRKAGLTSSEEARFRELVNARALVALFVAASHIIFTIGEAPTGEAEDPGEPPVASTTETLAWLVHRLATAARKAVDDEDLGHRMARMAANVVERVETDAHRMMAKDLPAFLAVAYALEDEGFHVRGFDLPSQVRAKKPLVMTFMKPHEVVGTHIAKSQALKLTTMLVAYDFERQKNPFIELGGFLFTFIGDGFPGTGKTTLIQMIAGLVKDYCDMAGYPFHYENFGIDQISEYQGKSGQNCRAFIDRVLDPKAIGFGTVDDIDQVAGRRDDRRSSAGQQEVTAVLMEAFSGAGTVIRGNCSYGMFSNYPEKVDDALRQRAGARWRVDGPQTEDDYVDIFALLLGKDHDIPLGDHDLYAAQQLQRAVARSYDKHSEPQEERLLEIWERFEDKEGMPRTIEDIGGYLHRIKEAEPRFTGRSIKNVTDAIKYRSLDVELPDEWFERPEDFMHKDYDEKLAMIASLRKPITMEMILQEVNRYADSEFRYTAKSDEAAVGELMRSHRVQKEAAERIREADSD